ncbi:RNA polymerase sigma factor [Wenzhouxiangella sp. XN79A]|uniref:RNA polymerase sigma factor n=1 Tax=Wenzhouxiangella sp. XN79A TaxID=2724193 RepID=UPI00144A7018|nr:RNA polymerase sigma factor [Wenzhouxiangella sp. XN79A]NKI36404.1 RNA polymerase sigma factor [Wenzhouxiangella sp. XN79A]
MDNAPAANDPADDETLEAFLAAVQPRAVVMARLSLGSEDDALDAVQDAMVAFVRRYGDRPAAERRPLFHRILDNRITDLHRSRTRRGKWWWTPGRNVEAPDPVEQATAEPAVLPGPEGHAEHEQFAGRLQTALAALPDRQRQVFLLRAWEQLDVRETAEALGVSTGSVKTHYFRAQARLRELLEHER